MSGSWRDCAYGIIADVIAKHGRDDTPELRKALKDAYPWGERRYWPYKVWCSEIQAQLGHPPRDKATAELFDDAAL